MYFFYSIVCYFSYKKNRFISPHGENVAVRLSYIVRSTVPKPKIAALTLALTLLPSVQLLYVPMSQIPSESHHDRIVC